MGCLCCHCEQSYWVAEIGCLGAAPCAPLPTGLGSCLGGRAEPGGDPSTPVMHTASSSIAAAFLTALPIILETWGMPGVTLSSSSMAGCGIKTVTDVAWHARCSRSAFHSSCCSRGRDSIDTFILMLCTPACLPLWQVG
jgi:hypothetical protein